MKRKFTYKRKLTNCLWWRVLCVKCKSYRIYKDECQACGTNQKEWYKENMISNLEQYGFKKSFLFNKWTLGDLVVKPRKDSSNMEIKIDGELKTISQYVDYKSFERFMDNLIGKNNKRNLIIEKILN